MARAKKERLSLEELLEQATVKGEEQPYKIPEKWIWVKLGVIVKFIDYRGKTPKKTESGIRLITAKNIKQGYISMQPEEFIAEGDYDGWMTRGIPEYGDVVITTEAPLGNVAQLELSEKFALAQRAIALSLSNEGDKRYLKYVLMSPYFQEKLRMESTGTTVLGIKAAKLKEIAIPLPNKQEQERIGKRIESLFKKLDTAKELVQNALDSFENRKAAILHKAFTGELTAKWREENGVSLESWEEKPLSEVCDAFQYGTSKKSQEQGVVVVLRMGNLQKGEIDWKNLAYTSDKEDIEKYLLKEGDVLFNRTNSAELVGKTSIYRGEYPAIFAGYLIRLKYKPCLNGEYLNYVLNSPNAKVYCNKVKSDGVNQSNINAKKIGQFIIPVCKIEEQQEIVKIVSRLLDNEQQVEELCDIIEKIDLMKKSILARAFRGELGTNNPEEESAENLLREILIKRLQADK